MKVWLGRIEIPLIATWWDHADPGEPASCGKLVLRCIDYGTGTLELLPEIKNPKQHPDDGLTARDTAEIARVMKALEEGNFWERTVDLMKSMIEPDDEVENTGLEKAAGHPADHRQLIVDAANKAARNHGKHDNDGTG